MIPILLNEHCDRHLRHSECNTEKIEPECQVMCFGIAQLSLFIVTGISTPTLLEAEHVTGLRIVSFAKFKKSVRSIQ